MEKHLVLFNHCMFSQSWIHLLSETIHALFWGHQCDWFLALIGLQATVKVGKFYKIRLELVPKSAERKPSWKVNEVKLTNVESEETLVFKFNRWLSREHEDMEIMRELPAIWGGEETPPGKYKIWYKI